MQGHSAQSMGGGEQGPHQKAPAGVCEFRDTMMEFDLSLLESIETPPPHKLPEILEMAGAQVRRMHKEWNLVYQQLILPQGDQAEQAFRQWKGGDFFSFLRSQCDMGRINQLFGLIEKKIAELQEHLLPSEKETENIELDWQGKQINAELIEDVRELKTLLQQIQEFI